MSYSPQRKLPELAFDDEARSISNVPILKANDVLSINADAAFLGKPSMFEERDDVLAFFELELQYYKMLNQDGKAISLVAVPVNPKGGQAAGDVQLGGFVILDEILLVESRGTFDYVLMATLKELVPAAYAKIHKGWIPSFAVDDVTKHINAFYMTLVSQGPKI